jgi:hypothetical protein
MTTYILKISALGVKADDVARVMNVPTATVRNGVWQYRIVEGPSEPHVDFVRQFLDTYTPKITDLTKLGIQPNNVTVWMMYEYDQQCNMEFEPKDLMALGTAGLKLCISCWQG